MKQKEIIDLLRTNLSGFKHVTSAILIGSFGRGNAVYNSDIDISLLVSSEFDAAQFQKELKRLFSAEARYVFKVGLRDKYVVYFFNSPKLEFNVCQHISDLDKYFLGSEIYDLGDNLLFDKENKLRNHLLKLIKTKKRAASNIKSLYVDTIDKFIYDFESFSHLHKRSSPYKSYFQYNLALNDCFQLLQLNTNITAFIYLPDIQAYFHGKEGREKLRRLSGTLYLPEVNQLKRNLLDLFYEIISDQKIISSKKIEELKNLCEWIYLRDYGYNFRDISSNCAKLKPGIIFRTSTLTRYQNNDYFPSILEKYRIRTIVDIRADREIKKDPYNKKQIKTAKIVWAPFDPWKRSEDFVKNHHYGSESEIAYRFFALECKRSIKKIVRTILNQRNNAMAIHCHAGKDRTGTLIALFYLLVGASEEEVMNDYLASEADTKHYKINTFLNEVHKTGSIENYFRSCGLSLKEIQALKLKISAQ